MQTRGVDVEGAGEFFLKMGVKIKASKNKEALFERLKTHTVWDEMLGYKKIQEMF